MLNRVLLLILTCTSTCIKAARPARSRSLFQRASAVGHTVPAGRLQMLRPLPGPRHLQCTISRLRCADEEALLQATPAHSHQPATGLVGLCSYQSRSLWSHSRRTSAQQQPACNLAMSASARCLSMESTVGNHELIEASTPLLQLFVV